MSRIPKFYSGPGFPQMSQPKLRWTPAQLQALRNGTVTLAELEAEEAAAVATRSSVSPVTPRLAAEKPSGRITARIREAQLEAWMSGWLKTASNPGQRSAFEAARCEFGEKATRDIVVKVFRRLRPDLRRRGPRVQQ